MTSPFIAELRIISFNFPPKGWALCNGQLLPINQNQALFAILGTTYGGNGQTTFALPDLRGRGAMHMSSSHPLGERGGEETHVLTGPELAHHTHVVKASSAAATSASPVHAVWANTGSVSQYATTSDSLLGPDAFQSAGGSAPHQNLPPYLVLNVVIALVGVFPSRT